MNAGPLIAATPVVHVYTDASFPQSAPPRWGAVYVISRTTVLMERSGPLPDWMNGAVQAEILAIAAALQPLEPGARFKVHTDCQAIVDIQRASYRTGKNANLRQARRFLINEIRRLQTVSIEWLRGHNGHPFNERAHALAAGIPESPLEIAAEPVELSVPTVLLAFSAGVQAIVESITGDAPR